MAYYSGIQTSDKPLDKTRWLIPVLAISTCSLLAILILALVNKQPEPNSASNQVAVDLNQAKELAAKAFEQQQNQNVAPIIRAEVLVPKETIWPGEKLAPEKFQKISRPIEGIESLVVKNFRELQGGYSRIMLVEGVPLLKPYVSSNPIAEYITHKIPKGFRAVAVPINAETGVEGWVRPGVRVDVVWSSEHRGRQIVSTIVQNAKVLSAAHLMTDSDNKGGNTGSNSNGSQDGLNIPKYVTLLLSVKDAQKIQLAKRTDGTLSLSLRGEDDFEDVGSETLSMDRLLKARDLEELEQVEGKVMINGKKFVLKGDSLKEDIK